MFDRAVELCSSRQLSRKSIIGRSILSTRNQAGPGRGLKGLFLPLLALFCFPWPFWGLWLVGIGEGRW